MRKSYDDLIIVQQNRGFLSSSFAFLQEKLVLKLLSCVIYWPMFHSYRVHHVYAAKAYLIYLTHKARFPDLIHFLMILMTESSLNKDNMWAISKLGTQLLQVRHLTPNVVVLTKIEDLTECILNKVAVQPSYDCSYTLICLSLWCFQRGQIEQALKLAALAHQADPTWGYPSYLLGWFACFTVDVDPFPYLMEAIKKEWLYTKRILNDKIIQNQTEVVKKIKQQLLISNLNKSKILISK